MDLNSKWAGWAMVVLGFGLLILLQMSELVHFGPRDPNQADVQFLVDEMQHMKSDMEGVKDEVNRCRDIVREYHAQEITGLDMVQNDVFNLRLEMEKKK
jgi:hypothetical protein